MQEDYKQKKDLIHNKEVYFTINTNTYFVLYFKIKKKYQKTAKYLETKIK